MESDCTGDRIAMQFDTASQDNIDEMRAYGCSLMGYSETINNVAIKFILCEFVMSAVSTDNMMNMDMTVESLRPQLEVTKEDIEPLIMLGLYHHYDLISMPSAFIKTI